MRQARCIARDDQMVAGATPATSSSGDELRPWWNYGLEGANAWERRGEKAAELTGRSMSSSVGSGATGARQIDERRLADTEVEDEGEDGVRRRLESHGSAGRCRATRRSYWARRRGEGVALVATTAIGGEVRARPSRERVRETRGSVREDERGTWGSRGIPGRLQGVGGSRRWPACGRGCRPRAPRPSGARRTTTGSASRLGRARCLGQHR